MVVYLSSNVFILYFTNIRAALMLSLPEHLNDFSDKRDILGKIKNMSWYCKAYYEIVTSMMWIDLFF